MAVKSSLKCPYAEVGNQNFDCCDSNGQHIRDFSQSLTRSESQRSRLFFSSSTR